MSDPIAVAIITTLGGVLTAFVGFLAVRVGKMQRDTTATREQVVNHHKTNMRDENDSRHAETAGWFRELRRDLGGIREELRALRSADHAIDGRVQQLEQLEITDPIRRRRPK